MYRGKHIGVVVPAYNEEGLVGEVIETLPPMIDRAYVIDDCSTDGTWDEIKRYAEAVDRERSDGGTMLEARTVITPIRHDRNRGVGRSIKTGYQRALRDGLDVIAVMNGDGQMNPDDFDRIIEPVVEGRTDYAKGNRLTCYSNYSTMSPYRLFGNYLLTFLTRMSSGYWEMQDPQNGYTAISAETLEAIPFEDLYDNYGFLNDMLTMLNVCGMKIADVPHEAVYDDEQSHIDYSSFIPRVSTLLFRNFVWRVKRQYFDRGIHPAAFSYALGILGMAVGLVVSVRRSLKAADHRSPARSSIVMITGAVAASLGLSLDIRENSGLVVQTSGNTEEETVKNDQ